MARHKQSNSACVYLVIIFFLCASSVSISARVAPLLQTYEKSIFTSNFHSIYDTSKYGILQLDNGLGRTPQMGWNSWNFFACNINETVIKETADALVSTGLADLGYVYVNIDDCWSSAVRNSKELLVPDPKTFPSGIKALSDYVHEKGLKLGIYSDAGVFTCQVRPGSLFHEVDDADTFASWEKEKVGSTCRNVSNSWYSGPWSAPAGQWGTSDWDGISRCKFSCRRSFDKSAGS